MCQRNHLYQRQAFTHPCHEMYPTPQALPTSKSVVRNSRKKRRICRKLMTALKFLCGFVGYCAADGTRTRDPRRDRPDPDHSLMERSPRHTPSEDLASWWHAVRPSGDRAPQTPDREVMVASEQSHWQFTSRREYQRTRTRK